MRVKEMLVVALLVASLCTNAWLLNERLEIGYYQKGVRDGRAALGSKVVAQVERTGRLAVTATDGRQIPLVVEQPAGRKAGLGDIMGGVAAAKAAAPKEE